jgi:two-component system, NarL family, sensor kinase
VIALLFLAFAWFCVRAVRRRLRAEALAGENERLLGERARMFEDVVDASEEERVRLAASIHDGPMQRLAALALTLDRAAGHVARGDGAALPEMLADVRRRVAEQMVVLRRMMVDLHPPVLHQMGLEAALREYVAQLNLRVPARCEFYAAVAVSRFPLVVETTFYRIAQEASSA